MVHAIPAADHQLMDPKWLDLWICRGESRSGAVFLVAALAGHFAETTPTQTWSGLDGRKIDGFQSDQFHVTNLANRKHF